MKWKQYPKDERYIISEKGDIYNEYEDIYVSIFPVNGRLHFNMNGRNLQRVDRIVAETFLDNQNNYKHLHYKDGNSLNNHKDNLEYTPIKKYSIKDIEEIKILLKNNDKEQLSDKFNINNHTSIRRIKGVLNNLNKELIYDENNEEWTNIKGYDNFILSSYGRVKNTNTNKLLPINFIGDEPYVNITNYKQNPLFLIKKLVLENFLNKEVYATYIRRKDGNKLNNHYTNLYIKGEK